MTSRECEMDDRVTAVISMYKLFQEDPHAHLQCPICKVGCVTFSKTISKSGGATYYLRCDTCGIISREYDPYPPKDGNVPS